MYIVPRPDAQEDPYFAVRLSVAVGLAIIAMVILRPDVPVMAAVLSYTVISGQRKAINPFAELPGQIIQLAMLWVIAALVIILRPLPSVLLVVMFCLFTLGFYITRRTGSPVGMIIVLISALLSITGMKNPVLVYFFRDSMMVGLLVVMAISPIVHGVFPAKTHEVLERETVPAWGYHLEGALIRAAILMALCFWLYSVLPTSDITLAVAAIFVLMFPSRESIFKEASNRIAATLYGGFTAAVTLWLYSNNGHLAVMICLLMLLALFYANRMMFGLSDHTLYQYAFSVTLSLVIGSIYSQSPANSIVSRVVLTLFGAVVAALLVAILDRLLLGKREQKIWEGEVE